MSAAAAATNKSKKKAKSGKTAAADAIEFTKDVAGQNLLLFYHGVFSQWYPAEFESSDFVATDSAETKTGDSKTAAAASDTNTNRSTTFCNAEQYMMAAKAHLFNDFESLRRIMSTKNGDPETVKKLGRAVSNFDQTVWNAACERIVTRGNVLKFGQNEALKTILLSTGDKDLAEASPYDKIYGIGLRLTDPAAADRARWKGTNLLGRCLMAARDELRGVSSKTGGQSSATADSKTSAASAVSKPAASAATDSKTSAASATPAVSKPAASEPAKRGSKRAAVAADADNSIDDRRKPTKRPAGGSPTDPPAAAASAVAAPGDAHD